MFLLLSMLSLWLYLLLFPLYDHIENKVYTLEKLHIEIEVLIVLQKSQCKQSKILNLNDNLVL